MSVNVRGEIGVGDDKRIMAFLLTDTGSVFSRAIGPTLAEYNLPPSITFYKTPRLDCLSTTLSTFSLVATPFLLETTMIIQPIVIFRILKPLVIT